MGERASNPNWKGGRVVASNGYILIRVGVGHHLADVRGYAYEHRLVAEKKIGRRIRKGEHVHHVDHDKTNNAPENLEVIKDVAHHRFEHRGPRAVPLRHPDEKNSRATCECGCGAIFDKYDFGGRPRRFVSGHNPHDRPALDAILELLRKARVSMHRQQIARAIGKTVRVTAVSLSRLRRASLAVPATRGRWIASR